jgi:L-asparaginase/Glu-tRNA(Gln) amidotransferase subunit D
MSVYSPGRELQSIGVLGNYSDMTPETTFIKLAWLLSNYSKDEVKSLICENLRGELLERIEKETFLN